ncbi:MAG: TetR/AcrR family transcriptional regulator [Blastocatellia bacterium]|nr:TetR/AcrR family transcriptional regulator [Blastocatellia bacterium]MBN8721489.1 TetR/AcrR family transcriptional regulator [Acidobacteriota bacterium]
MVTRLTQQNQIQEKILDTAAQLFYEKGLQAVGVDEIVLQAGIAKMTLYKYFLSKDQLILAVVERSEEKWWNWFTTELYQRSKLPKKQLLIIFDLLFSSFQETNYRGEPFINAQIRVLDTMYPIFLVSEKFISQLKDLILDKVKLANIANPNQVAEQFILLIIGANILCNIDKEISKTAIRNAKKLASLLLKSCSLE